MKRISFLLFFFFFMLSIMAQETEIRDITSVFNACVAMRNAVADSDTAAIKRSSKELGKCNVQDFEELECCDEKINSLNGHLVFNVAFADSLAEGKDVYERADEINSSYVRRGQFSDGSIRTKTCFVKAGEKTKYIFNATGHQEIGVVAEAGGLVTMKIQVTNSLGFKKRFDDKKKVKQGLPYRKASFELPLIPKSKVELEIINCGKQDCTFAIISN